MILFAVYALGIWTIAWRHRRRWPAFAAIFAGVPPILISARLDVWLVEKLFGEDAWPLFTLGLIFAGIVVFVGLVLAVQPRSRPTYACRSCGYDLRGLASPVCPECGVTPGGSVQPALDRSPSPALSPAPSPGVAAALAEARRERRRASSTFSDATTTAPTNAANPTADQ